MWKRFQHKLFWRARICSLTLASTSCGTPPEALLFAACRAWLIGLPLSAAANHTRSGRSRALPRSPQGALLRTHRDIHDVHNNQTVRPDATTGGRQRKHPPAALLSKIPTSRPAMALQTSTGFGLVATKAAAESLHLSAPPQTLL